MFVYNILVQLIHYLFILYYIFVRFSNCAVFVIIKLLQT